MPGLLRCVGSNVTAVEGGTMSSSCQATLGPLHCTRESEHVPDAGCVYVSSSSAPDVKADADRYLEDRYA